MRGTQGCEKTGWIVDAGAIKAGNICGLMNELACEVEG